MFYSLIQKSKDYLNVYHIFLIKNIYLINTILYYNIIYF